MLDEIKKEIINALNTHEIESLRVYDNGETIDVDITLKIPIDASNNTKKKDGNK